ncbi:MAG: hypothetical protein Sv326_0199 [Candidatus Fermentimicrarchaeum limneticum]|uniref:Uncharacterized protein n=1 Tax=Fermentimicrarchaeum limneticum TaxID=2795018 RepID=A0A7D5XHI7_FERL1|nr:MAG: hypothetical protein Sv326_0199 [Candidatus Fermentimicrarchaeum limneticum]
MAEVTGKFFGAGRKNNRNWVAVDSDEGREFFTYPKEFPVEVRKLRRGSQVTVEYDGVTREIKSIAVISEAEVAKDKYDRYRKYQIELLKECLEDAAKISKDKEDAKLIAFAMFDKRCTPLAYFE